MKRLISCQGCRLCIRCDSIPATPFLLDRCQSGKDLLRNFPDLVLPVLQIFDILRIDGAGLIGSFCVLIQVVAAVTGEALLETACAPTAGEGHKKIARADDQSVPAM